MVDAFWRFAWPYAVLAGMSAVFSLIVAAVWSVWWPRLEARAARAGLPESRGPSGV
jgi:hypothetical protein